MPRKITREEAHTLKIKARDSYKDVALKYLIDFLESVTNENVIAEEISFDEINCSPRDLYQSMWYYVKKRQYPINVVYSEKDRIITLIYKEP